MVQGTEPFHCCKPGPPLSECVDFFWSYESYCPSHTQERLLPSGAMELVFALHADGSVTGGIAGPRSQFRELDTSRSFSVYAVHFKVGGGFPFFGVPTCELHNRHLPLDTVWGGHAAALTDQLFSANTTEQRFRVLEQALMRRAGDSLNRRHPAVRFALDVFERSKGAQRVTDVVQRIGLSPRRFVDVFRSEVGLSPKAFCRVRRFNEALGRIERLTDVDWADVALSCGYFDQAHFNHDFRAFAGLSPSAYLRHRVARLHVAMNAPDLSAERRAPSPEQFRDNSPTNCAARS